MKEKFKRLFNAHYIKGKIEYKDNSEVKLKLLVKQSEGNKKN